MLVEYNVSQKSLFESPKYYYYTLSSLMVDNCNVQLCLIPIQILDNASSNTSQFAIEIHENV